MGLKNLLCVLCGLLISGCATARMPVASPDNEKVRTFADIYRRAKQAGLTVESPLITLGPAAGMEKPYFPVYEPPVIVKVWVPVHTADHDKNILVAGHWTFLVVEQGRWYIERTGMGKMTAPVIVPTAPVKE